MKKFEKKVWLSSPTMHGPEIEYVKEAYEAKKWAFITDYVRLYVLKNIGGIYMDTDVEVIGRNGISPPCHEACRGSYVWSAGNWKRSIEQ